VPEELTGFATRRTRLALLGRERPAVLGRHLPATRVWNARGQPADQAAAELAEFLAEMRAAPPDRRFVIKLDATSRARGVTLWSGGQAPDAALYRRMLTAPGVGQAYVPRPCLLPAPTNPGLGFKWDMRVYLLVVVDALPTRRAAAFVYPEGFARRCRHPFVDAAGDNDRSAHITNTAVNNKLGERGIVQLALDNFKRWDALSEAERAACPQFIGDQDDYEEALAAFDNLSDAAHRHDGGDMPITMLLSEAWRRLGASGRYSEAQVAQAQVDVDSLITDLLETCLHPTVQRAPPPKGAGPVEHLDLKEEGPGSPAVVQVVASEPGQQAPAPAGEQEEEREREQERAQAQAQAQAQKREQGPPLEPQHPAQAATGLIGAGHDAASSAGAGLTYRRHLLLLGLDVLLNEDLKPHLLEINRFPDLACYSLEQLKVKEQLIRDTIACVFPDAPHDVLFSPSTNKSRLEHLWAREINPKVPEGEAQAVAPPPPPPPPLDPGETWRRVF